MILRPFIVVCAGSIVAVLGLGCGADFLPASVVINERVIAVTSEPPESTPGAQVTFTPTVVSPHGELVAGTDYDAVWWRCPDSDSDALGDFDQCTDPSLRKNIATGSPYSDDVPVDIFGPLPDPNAPPSDADPLPSDKLLGAIMGYWRVVGFNMHVEAGVDGERTVDAFKREPIYLPVRLADVDPRLAPLDSHVDQTGAPTGSNTNPTISAVQIHEDKPDGPTKLEIDRTKHYFFTPVFDDNALQPYISLKVDLEGLDLSNAASLKQVPVDDMLKRFQKVQRCEVPTFSWFVTHGRVARDTTLDEGVIKRVFDAKGVDCPPVEGDERLPQVEYTPPTGEADDPLPEDDNVHGWVVMRDGRGGTAVKSFDFSIK